MTNSGAVFRALIIITLSSMALIGCGPDAPVTATGGASQVVAFEKDGSTVTSISIDENTSIDNVKFVVNGSPASASDLEFSVVSSNQVLLPNNNIILTGSDKFRFITITPTMNQSGETTLTGTITNTSTNESLTGTLLLKVLSDMTHPVLTEVTPVVTPSTNVTPEYTFHSTEAGEITYGGDCSSSSTSAVAGNNTVVFDTISVGVHSNCTITVTDAASNASNTLTVSSFDVFVRVGYVTTDFTGFDDHGVGVVIQPDNKIVVSGSSHNGVDYDFAAVRYNNDGTLDTSFSADGIVTTPLGTAGDYGTRVAIQSDGKLLVVGYIDVGASARQFALVRYNTDGSIDTSFSGDGFWTASIGTYDLASDITIQSDGKILIAGRALISGSHYTLVRFNTDGSKDTSFSGDGIATAVIYGANFANSVRVQSDGKIVVAGYVYTNTPDVYDFGVARFNTNGSLDASFSGDGILRTDFGLSLRDYGKALAIQDDDKIIIGGLVSNGADYDFGLIRYNTGGGVDTSFGTNGKVFTDFDLNLNESLSDIILQDDGKILAVGNTFVNGFNDIALARYNTDGSLDTSFGDSGKLTTAIGAVDDRGAGVTLQSDGKIVVSGTTFNGNDDDFVVVRYNSDGTLDTQSFGPSL